MSCKRTVERLIRMCGREVRFPAEEGQVSFLAYLNPVREKSDRIIPTESGVFHQGRWLLLAAAEDAPLVKNGAVFYAGEEPFVVERAEKVFFGKELIYLWAMVSKAEGCEMNG